MQPKLHGYHLDDAPNLKSCNLFISSLPSKQLFEGPSLPIGKDRLANFYGKSKEPRVRYVREKKKPDYGKAPEEEYYLDLLDGA